jgi:hypothetical protein
MENIHFQQDGKEQYANNWQNSVNVSKSLIKHIQSLEQFSSKHLVFLNDLQQTQNEWAP